jgi:hypothetical protein
MLAFLESLCAALTARDAARIAQLLAHPLSRALPRAVRDEASAIAGGSRQGFVAPLHTMRLYHQTAHLLGARVDPAVRSGAAAQSGERRQMELPLEVMATR